MLHRQLPSFLLCLPSDKLPKGSWAWVAATEGGPAEKGVLMGSRPLLLPSQIPGCFTCTLHLSIIGQGVITPTLQVVTLQLREVKATGPQHEALTHVPLSRSPNPSPLTISRSLAVFLRPMVQALCHVPSSSA